MWPCCPAAVTRTSCCWPQMGCGARSAMRWGAAKGAWFAVGRSQGQKGAVDTDWLTTWVLPCICCACPAVLRYSWLTHAHVCCCPCCLDVATTPAGGGGGGIQGVGPVPVHPPSRHGSYSLCPHRPGHTARQHRQHHGVVCRPSSTSDPAAAPCSCGGPSGSTASAYDSNWVPGTYCSSWDEGWPPLHACGAASTLCGAHSGPCGSRCCWCSAHSHLRAA